MNHSCENTSLQNVSVENLQVLKVYDKSDILGAKIYDIFLESVPPPPPPISLLANIYVVQILIFVYIA